MSEVCPPSGGTSRAKRREGRAPLGQRVSPPSGGSTRRDAAGEEGVFALTPLRGPLPGGEETHMASTTA